jgi:hypothetical protein
MARIRAGQAAGAPTGGGAPVLGRRTLLGMALAWVLVPSRRASAESESRRGTFSARATMLYGAFRFEESGTIHESIDRTAGRYEVRITGHGASMSTEIESTGTLRAGRWAPLRFTDRFVVYGRESRLDIALTTPDAWSSTAAAARRSSSGASGSPTTTSRCPRACTSTTS